MNLRKGHMYLRICRLTTHNKVTWSVASEHGKCFMDTKTGLYFPEAIWRRTKHLQATLHSFGPGRSFVDSDGWTVICELLVATATWPRLLGTDIPALHEVCLFWTKIPQSYPMKFLLGNLYQLCVYEEKKSCVLLDCLPKGGKKKRPSCDQGTERDKGDAGSFPGIWIMRNFDAYEVGWSRELRVCPIKIDRKVFLSWIIIALGNNLTEIGIRFFWRFHIFTLIHCHCGISSASHNTRAGLF